MTSQTEYYITDAPENRGVIWRKNCEGGDDILVCKTFPYSEEYDMGDEKISEKLSQGTWKFYPSYEGTIIRVVNDPHTGIHLISTHKKISAYESYWGSTESFGELFEKSLSEHYRNKVTDEVKDVFSLFLSLIPKTHHHTFLLCSNLDTKVVADRDNEIFYVGSFDASTNNYVGILDEVKESISNFCNSISPISISSDSNVSDELNNYVDNINPLKQQGVIAIRQDEFDVFKILNPVYKSLSELRGNNASLIKRFLELYNNQSHMVDDFVHFFSNQSHIFQQYEEIYENVLHYLYFVVSERYEKGKYVNTSAHLHNIAKKFENLAKTNGVNLSDIKEYFKTLTPDELIGVFNSYIVFLSKSGNN